MIDPQNPTYRYKPRSFIVRSTSQSPEIRNREIHT